MDKKNQLLDVFDEEYNHIGTETYENVHEEGLWHHNLHCWIVNPDTMRILVIQLDGEHLMMPNKFDVAIFGQMAAGEGILDGKKELESKFGINIEKNELIKIGITKEVCFLEGQQLFHRVFAHSYLVKKTSPLSSYTKNMKNISGLFEVSINDALELFSDKAETIKAIGVLVDGSPIVRDIKYEDFTLRGKSYLYKTLFLLNSWLEVESWEEKYKGELETQVRNDSEED
jgi:hypothetical protein